MLKYPSCAGWHGAGNSYWLSSTSSGFIRGYDGVFSFTGDFWTGYNYCGRGVAVVKSAVRAERVTDDLCDGAECSARYRTLI